MTPTRREVTRRQLLAGAGMVASAVVVAACGAVPATPAEAPKAADKPAEAAKPAATKERVVVVWGAKDWNPQRNPTIEAIAKAAQAKNPNIELKLDVTVPGGGTCGRRYRPSLSPAPPLTTSSITR